MRFFVIVATTLATVCSVASHESIAKAAARVARFGRGARGARVAQEEPSPELLEYNSRMVLALPDQCLDRSLSPFALSEKEKDCIFSGETCSLADSLKEHLGAVTEPFDVTPLIDALASAMDGAGIDSGLARASLVKAKVRWHSICVCGCP